MIEQDNQYIDVDLADIVEARIRAWPADERKLLSRLARHISTYYYLCFRKKSEHLKSLYRHFDPNAPDRRPPVTPASRSDFMASFYEQISELLAACNFRELSMEEIQKALDEEALFELRISVNLEDYDRLLVFRRGAQQRSLVLKRWFGRFGERRIDFINYDRVALVYTGNAPGSDIHLKLFQNVPRHDIEILLPEPQVRMRLRDKLIIGVPAVAGGAVVLLTKLGPTLLLLGSLFAFWLGLKDKPVQLDKGALIALGVGLMALASHFWRQLGAVKNRKLKFLSILTQNLYFKSLDNNSGVIQHLLDTAAEEEIKEVFLVYSFLLLAPRPLSAEEVDTEIEQWLQHNFNCETNFDVSDAANKAVALRLAHRQEARYSAIPLERAVDTMGRALQALVRSGEWAGDQHQPLA